MSGRVSDLEKKYIVYKFYESEDLDFFRKNKIQEPPVIIVFDNEKEVALFEGIETIENITKGVKTKEEQKDPWYPDWLKFW